MDQARCRIIEPAGPPIEIPAKYYHDGLYPARCNPTARNWLLESPRSSRQKVNKSVYVCTRYSTKSTYCGRDLFNFFEILLGKRTGGVSFNSLPSRQGRQPV